MSEKVERQALGDMSNGVNHPAQESPAQVTPAQVTPAQENPTQATPAQNGTQKNGDPEKQTPGQLKSAKEKVASKQQKLKDMANNPPGGFDATPIPHARDGYTVRFTFHRAENLPASDLNTRSSDPFILATLTSSLLKRHKEDPDLVMRTQTVHKNTNPEWNKTWTVAGIPGSGFRLKCRLYDEDPADHDDRLGNVTIYAESLGPNWQGFKERGFDVKKRMGSKRAYGVRACAAMFSSNVHMDGTLYVSAELLGPSEEPYGRMYTVAETYFFKHYSPMIGRLAGTKAPGSESGDKPQTEKYE
jgi:hypothetical protein